MKKLLLLFLLLTLNSFAQLTCESAIPITSNGLIAVQPIAGSYNSICFDNTVNNSIEPMAGIWYQFIPTSLGVVTVTSNLASNVSPNNDDTRVSVLSGICNGVLTCLESNDDISLTNYLSSSTFNVEPGVTYFILWDNYWNGAGFNFNFNFTPITCLPVEITSPSDYSINSITLNWNASLSNPSQYKVEYGPVGFTQGTGITLTTFTNSISITGLAHSTSYDYYVRSNCGTAGFSSWSTLSSYTTAKVCPQNFSFENSTELNGFTTSGNGTYGLSGNAPTLAHSGNYYWLFNTNPTTNSNNWLFSPPFLNEGESVSVTFWTRCATTRSLRFRVGEATTSVAQTTQLWSNQSLLSPTFSQQTSTDFVASTAGIYYFAWNDVSNASTTASLRIDTINFSSVFLGTNEISDRNITVYPNPAKNVINISNALNATVDTVIMTDLNGRVVKNLKVNASEAQVAISDLAAGIYMMNISTDQGSVTKKIIKE